MTEGTYSTKYVSEVTGASPQVIRTYTSRYKRFFSTEATPERGQPRRFTADDVRLIRFVYESTGRQSMSHDAVAAALEAGALDTFDWHVEEAQSGAEPPHDAGAALVPVERLHAAHALMQDAQQREEAAREEAEHLRQRIEALREELGETRGELRAWKQQRRPWWARLFGG